MKLDKDELKKHIFEKRLHSNTSIIVQQRIHHHKKLTSLSTGALVTVRVVTMRDVENKVSHLMSVLVISVDEKLLRHRVILSPINEKTGELGISTTYGARPIRFTKHPDTDFEFVGYKVPFWDEVMNLTKEAHRSFLEYASLGWDVAITNNGPVILETNKIWDVETMQNPHNTPLGKTEFIELCMDIIDSKK